MLNEFLVFVSSPSSTNGENETNDALCCAAVFCFHRVQRAKHISAAALDWAAPRQDRHRAYFQRIPAEN